MGRSPKDEPVVALSRPAFAIVLAVAALLGLCGNGSAAPVRVSAVLDRHTVEFGDPITATVTVFLDDDAGDVHVEANLGPLTQLGRTRVTQATRGGVHTVTYSFRASCLDQRCLSRSGPKRVALRPVVVQTGSRKTAAIWPVLDIRPRVSPTDVSHSRPAMRSDTSPPPVGYRVAPRHLVQALDIAAALLAAAGVLLAGWTAMSLYRRRRRVAPLAGLQRALALAREAEERPVPDRRRALGLLARLLNPRDPRLAGAADDLAWSAPAPTGDALAEIVAEVEHEASET
jgi:hypothetical protein